MVQFKDNKREEAEKLYVQQSMTCPQIAAKLGVNDGTVYRWKAEAAGQGETTNWDAQRRTFNMSPRELVSIYSEILKAWVVRIKQNPETLSDPKIADAVVKHVSALRKLDNRSQYLGVALDLIKITNQWLAENQPELKAKMEPYWENIYQKLAKYSTNKELFG
jgi:DNA-binding transcriptional regulator LsrR (DeoR family)